MAQVNIFVTQLIITFVISNQIIDTLWCLFKYTLTKKYTTKNVSRNMTSSME